MNSKRIVICSLAVLAFLLGVNTYLGAEDEKSFGNYIEAVPNLTGTWDYAVEGFCSPGSYTTDTGVATINEQIGSSFRGKSDTGRPWTGAINGNVIIVTEAHGRFGDCKLINSRKFICLSSSFMHGSPNCSGRMVFTKR